MKPQLPKSQMQTAMLNLQVLLPVTQSMSYVGQLNGFMLTIEAFIPKEEREMLPNIYLSVHLYIYLLFQ